MHPTEINISELTLEQLEELKSEAKSLSKKHEDALQEQIERQK